MAKKLELKFLNTENKIVTISMDDPIEPADAVAINSAMDVIILQNALSSAGGDLVAKHSARIVERNVVDVQL